MTPDGLNERVARIEVRLEDLSEIRADVKKLLAFRGWVVGAASAAGAIGGFILDIIRRGL
jgi:hypothetical protein